MGEGHPGPTGQEIDSFPAGSHPLVGAFAPPQALTAIGADTVWPVPARIDGLPDLVVRPDGYIESVS